MIKMGKSIRQIWVNYFFQGRIYKGMVGDRTVILRQRGGTFNNNFPTIEIIQGQSSDMVFYMGKNWRKGP